MPTIILHTENLEEILLTDAVTVRWAEGTEGISGLTRVYFTAHESDPTLTTVLVTESPEDIDQLLRTGGP